MNRELSHPTTPLGSLHPDPSMTIRGPDGDAEPLPDSAIRLSGAYTCFEVLGEGGTAVVRRAHQRSLDREVAVKTPRRGKVSTASMARVLQEAWVTGSLQHPGVVPVHDVVLDDEGCPHIVMRRIEGWTWTELINRPELVEETFGVRDVLEWHLRVLMAVAATVHHAHGRGVLHRDLKPDNVMVGPAGETYVLDWGLAVALDGRASHRLPLASAQTALAGTPHYLAPEMARADGPALAATSDVYLLGGLLYAVLTRSPPHPGSDPHAVVKAAAVESPLPPVGAPLRLAALCMESLAMSPQERPASAEVFRRSVQSFLEERDADALAEAGGEALLQLQLACAAPDSTEVPALYATCRVAFEQGLARSPGHAAAATGLRTAQERRIRWELARGDAVLATELLGAMADPPAELVTEARRVSALAATRNAEAGRLLAEHDQRVGIRTRAFVSLILGSYLTLLPLATHLFDRDAGLDRIVIGFVVTIVVMSSVWVWARDSLSRSVLNRALIRVVVATPILQLLLIVGGAAMGFDSVQLVVFFPLVATVISATFAVTLEPTVGYAAAGYAVAFLLAAWQPPLRWLVISGANGLLAVVVRWRWGPGALRSWIRMRREKGGMEWLFGTLNRRSSR